MRGEATLARTRALLSYLGDPQLAYPSILVAGTKGKGSTVAMIASCLQAAGFRIGRYTSPHLLNWRERTWVDGGWITPAEVVSLLPEIRRAVARIPANLGAPTTFEVGTALTFAHFARAAVDAAVVEVGVGGRYDATNVLDPLVSVITPISLDHQATLGSSLAEIAAHKAGVLRPRRVGIVAPQEPGVLAVLERIAREMGAREVRIGREWRWRPTRGERFLVEGELDGRRRRLSVRLPLLGRHQRDNATVAVAAADAFTDAIGQPISDTALLDGLARLQWPGRLEVLGHEPLLVVDGAHNRASSEALVRALREELAWNNLHLVVGTTREKDAAEILLPLLPLASTLALTRARHGRARDPAEMLAVALQGAPSTPITLHEQVGAALACAIALAGPRDLVLATGSLFLVGEAIAWAASRDAAPGHAPG